METYLQTEFYWEVPMALETHTTAFLIVLHQDLRDYVIHAYQWPIMDYTLQFFHEQHPCLTVGGEVHGSWINIVLP